MSANTRRPGRVVILGAGPTGLGAAFYLAQTGFDDWALYERDGQVGGLAKSLKDERGFTWDIGAHVVFSHYDVYSRLLDGLFDSDGWIEHQRESWVRLLDRWVPYPFQNNIHRLPPADRARCLEGLIQAATTVSGTPFANFEDFILRTFGRGIADLFMLPYNRKIWACQPAQMAANWIGERVAVVDPQRVARNVIHGVDDVDWGPNRTFRFPRSGGTGAIWASLARRLPASRIVTRNPAVALDPDARTIRFADGTQERYRTLISTIPIDQLAKLSGRKAWIDAATNLSYSSTWVIGVGLEGKAPEELATKCWVYFPEDNCPFYRVTHYSLYSPNNVADITRQWSLLCEVSESAEKPVCRETIVKETIRGLIATGMIASAKQVSHTWLHRVEYGYPTPTRERDQVLYDLLPDMERCGIVSRGRFGAWRYEVANQDHSFMQGFEAAAHILFGAPELTVWHPGLVNTPHPALGWDRWQVPSFAPPFSQPRYTRAAA